MRKIIASAVVMGILAMSSAANAAPLSSTGYVKAFSLKAHTLTLKTGRIFRLPTDFKDPGIKSGEKVKIAYEKVGKKYHLETVSILKS